MPALVLRLPRTIAPAVLRLGPGKEIDEDTFLPGEQPVPQPDLPVPFFHHPVRAVRIIRVDGDPETRVYLYHLHRRRPAHFAIKRRLFRPLFSNPGGRFAGVVINPLLRWRHPQFAIKRRLYQPPFSILKSRSAGVFLCPNLPGDTRSAGRNRGVQRPIERILSGKGALLQ